MDERINLQPKAKDIWMQQNKDIGRAKEHKSGFYYHFVYNQEEGS